MRTRGFIGTNRNFPNRNFRSVLALSAAIAAAGVTASLSQATPIFRTVALTGTDGQFGPGAGVGVTFFAIDGQPSVNDAGQVAFRGQESITGNPNGIWVNDGAISNATIALNGQAMPGGGTYPTGAAATFNTISINNSGQTAWRLGASSGAFSNDTVNSYRQNFVGDSAPETTTSGPSATYQNVSSGMPLLNRNGQVGFLGNLNVNASLTPAVVISGNVTNNSGVWIGSGANMHLVYRQNDTITSLDNTGNTRAGVVTNSSMSMNNNGRYILSSSLQGTNVVTGSGAGSNSQMIATNRSGSFEVIARNGSTAPDAAGAASATDLYRTLSTSTMLPINDLGHTAFGSSLRNAAGTTTSAGALFTDVQTGTLRRLANATEAMPTIYSHTGSALSEFSGVTWGSIFNNLIVNSSDDLLAVASGWGNTTKTSGMLLFHNGDWQKIERNGDVAITAGAPNGSDAFFGSTSSYQMNASGQVAFTASLTGTQVSGGFNNAASLWVSDVDGTLIKIARASDLFEVAPGDSRTILSIGGLINGGGQDGHTINLSDNGNLSFELNFTDGTSGVFVANVPEPTGVIGAGLAVLGCLRRRRRAAN